MTKISVKPGDQFGLGGKTFVVSASQGDHCLAYPAGKPLLEQQFARSDLGALLGRSDFSFTPGGKMPLATVARPSINTLNPIMRKTVQRRVDYTEGYIRLLGATEFLNSKAARYKKAIAGFAPDAIDALLAHSWPGNVRELEHVVERAVVLATGDVIEYGDLSLRRPAVEAPAFLG